VHAINDDRLEAWPDFFVERGIYRITTAENHQRGLPLPLMYADSRAMLRDRVNALRHANVYEAQRYRHCVSAVLAERIDTHTARAVSTFQVLRIMHSGETTLFASGCYRDRIRLAGENGLAQFEERLVVIDSRRVDTLMAIPL
jgi:anthranilate 1,2-dioxygenase small subunit